MTNIPETTDRNVLVIQRGKSREELAADGQELLDSFTWTYEDKLNGNGIKYPRIREGWVSNGLSLDGIELFEYPGPIDYYSNGPSNCPKHSWGYMDCIGLVIVGTDVETGEKISLMTHQAPQETIKEDEFKAWLKPKLEELKTKAGVEGLSICIFAGKDGFSSQAYNKLVHGITNVRPKEDYETQEYYDRHFSSEAHLRRLIENYFGVEEVERIVEAFHAGEENFLLPFLEKLKANYDQSVKNTSQVVKSVLGTDAQIDVLPPTRGSKGTNAYLDTSNSLFVILNESDDDGELFLPSELEGSRDHTQKRVKDNLDNSPN